MRPRRFGIPQNLQHRRRPFIWPCMIRLLPVHAEARRYRNKFLHPTNTPALPGFPGYETDGMTLTSPTFPSWESTKRQGGIADLCGQRQAEPWCPGLKVPEVQQPNPNHASPERLPPFCAPQKARSVRTDLHMAATGHASASACPGRRQFLRRSASIAARILGQWSAAQAMAARAPHRRTPAGRSCLAWHST